MVAKPTTSFEVLSVMFPLILPAVVLFWADAWLPKHTVANTMQIRYIYNFFMTIKVDERAITFPSSKKAFNF
jgi:hypothetical protein